MTGKFTELGRSVSREFGVYTELAKDLKTGEYVYLGVHPVLSEDHEFEKTIILYSRLDADSTSWHYMHYEQYTETIEQGGKQVRRYQPVTVSYPRMKAEYTSSTKMDAPAA